MCLLCGTDWIFIYNSTFCPHSAFMCFVWISEQTVIISLHSFNLSVFETEAESVYCAERTGSLNHTDTVSYLRVNDSPSQTHNNGIINNTNVLKMCSAFFSQWQTVQKWNTNMEKPQIRTPEPVPGNTNCKQHFIIINCCSVPQVLWSVEIRLQCNILPLASFTYQ